MNEAAAIASGSPCDPGPKSSAPADTPGGPMRSSVNDSPRRSDSL